MVAARGMAALCKGSAAAGGSSWTTTRRTRRREARAALEGRYVAALARVRELESDLFEERAFGLRAPASVEGQAGHMQLVGEVQERVAQVVPVIEAEVLGQPVPQRRRVLRNLALHCMQCWNGICAVSEDSRGVIAGKVKDRTTSGLTRAALAIFAAAAASTLKSKAVPCAVSILR